MTTVLDLLPVLVTWVIQEVVFPAKVRCLHHFSTFNLRVKLAYNNADLKDANDFQGWWLFLRVSDSK